MCGIAGKVNRHRERPVDAQLIQGMTRCVVHRGPDDEGMHVSGPMGFGFRRLAIIDLNRGHQPMSNEDGSVVAVFNGEIYNFADLRTELAAAGHVFKTDSDTETIVHGYEQWGTKLPERLRGMFAFAVYNFKTHELFAARDRLGKKPLYYAHLRIGSDEECLLFASELKSIIVDPLVERNLDTVGVSHYFSLQYVPHPMSILRDVKKVPPAHWLRYREGRLDVESYWQLAYEPKWSFTEEQAVEQTLGQLDEAVRLRLVSDVPLGCFLSGGIDSSAVVAIMRQHVSGPLRTFSIGFGDEQFNELPYARQVAQQFETVHEEFIVEPNAIECLNELAWYFDEPMADSSAIPTYYVSKMTRQYVTVALNGDGGDESFAGYHRYKPLKQLEQYKTVPNPLRRAAGGMLAALPSSSRVKWLRFVNEMSFAPDEAVYAQTLLIFKEYQKRQLLAPELRHVLNEGEADSEQFLYDAWNHGTARELIDRKMQTDISSYLPGDLLVKADRMTMANSLEGRSPFLDHKLMEFAARIPVHIKFKSGDTKYLLKTAMQKYFTREFLYRPKMGFAIPLARWLRDELREPVGDLILGSRAKARGIWNHSFVEQLWREHQKDVRDHSHRLWVLVMFEAWCRTYLDSPTAAPAKHVIG